MTFGVTRGASAPQKFGALNMTAALGPLIMRHPLIKDGMEQFMLQHVYAEFTAPEPYLRAIVNSIQFTNYLILWSDQL